MGKEHGWFQVLLGPEVYSIGGLSLGKSTITNNNVRYKKWMFNVRKEIANYKFLKFHK